MDLIINGKIIREPIINILNEVRREIRHPYLNQIEESNDDVKITCPFHKNGMENRPSCYVYNKTSDDKIYYGTVHCFTCGKTVPLSTLIGYCFDKDDEFGKQWLASHYGSDCTDDIIQLDKIELKENKYNSFLNEKVLQQYNSYHPYMTKRNISIDVLKKFKIGYDSLTNSITFPVWDVHNRLLFVSKRSVNGKKFYIESKIEKPVYLLNFIETGMNNIIVCEGQIDALVAWSYGYPAVALFGSGTTQYQMNLLNKSGIRSFILMYDNDEAGRNGAKRFKNMVNKDILVTDIIMPKNKDIGDCSPEEFKKILMDNGIC